MFRPEPFFAPTRKAIPATHCNQVTLDTDQATKVKMMDQPAPSDGFRQSTIMRIPMELERS